VVITATESPIKRSRKPGIPAGELVYIEQPTKGKVKLTVFNYGESSLEEREIETVNECVPFREKQGVTWLNVDGIHDTKLLQQVADCYHIDSLVLEDIATSDRRPKVEVHGAYIFIVMKMLSVREKSGKIDSEQVSLIIGPKTLISFQEKIGDVFDAVRERIRNNVGPIRRRGPDFLAYSLIDAVVDSYFAVLEMLGEKITEIEDELVSDPRSSTLAKLYGIKRTQIHVRRAIWPLRDVISALERKESALIHENTGPYLRDAYDHIIQALDTLEVYREMLSEETDIYVSSISNRLNEVMKVLTIITTVFIPPTLIASIYGMNFIYLPEIYVPWAYPLVLLSMLILGLVMIAWFRKKRWF
jgi:magnesium transporter